MRCFVLAASRDCIKSIEIDAHGNVEAQLARARLLSDLVALPRRGRDERSSTLAYKIDELLGLGVQAR